MRFIQDCAPDNFSIVVHSRLHVSYSWRWIEYGGQVTCPPRSPDLNPLDFFFWSHLQSLVYETTVTTAEDLTSRVTSTSAEIASTPNLFECVQQSFVHNLVALHFKYDFWHMTATADSDVVQSGRPIFDDFFQHLWRYIGNNTANVVFQMVKRLWLIRIDPTENSLAVLNHKILEANSQVQNVKLGGHQTCLSINRLWHELCDMLRRLVGTTAPGHHDCSIQE
ncbi:uncharacterized protein TNCV_3142051 [Trichonephila clavipes]|nr:uncharacterized protein TNCV_3142051 [Trichonephila clavipes]